MKQRGHRLTGVFIFAAAFIAYAVALLMSSAPTPEVWLSPLIYLAALVMASMGLLFGFLINRKTKWHKLVNFMTGQAIVTLPFLYLLSMPVPYDDYDAALAGDTTQTNISIADSAGFSAAIRNTYEQVLYHMEEIYPLGAYDLLEAKTAYVNNDSSGNSGITCTILFSLKEEQNKKFISRYLVMGGRLTPVFVRKDTTSVEYREFMKGPVLN